MQGIGRHNNTGQSAFQQTGENNSSQPSGEWSINQQSGGWSSSKESEGWSSSQQSEGWSSSKESKGWSSSKESIGWRSSQQPGGRSTNEQSGWKSFSDQMLPPKKRGDWKDENIVEVKPGQGETERQILPGVIRHTSCPHTNLAFYYQTSRDSTSNK